MFLTLMSTATLVNLTQFKMPLLFASYSFKRRFLAPDNANLLTAISSRHLSGLAKFQNRLVSVPPVQIAENGTVPLTRTQSNGLETSKTSTSGSQNAPVVQWCIAVITATPNSQKVNLSRHFTSLSCPPSGILHPGHGQLQVHFCSFLSLGHNESASPYYM